MENYRLLNQDEVYYLCKIILEDKRNISVGKTIMRYARLNPDAQLFRTIHTKLLETGKYEETHEVDKYGLKRIRYIPKKAFKDRYWWLIALISYFAGVLTPILTEKTKSYIQPNTTQTSTTKVSQDSAKNISQYK